MSNDFEINEHQLDREWVGQPALVHRYHLELADAQRTLATIKADVEVTKAELDKVIRETSEKKPTESAITNMVLTAPEYREAMAAMIDAKHACDVLQAACTALEHKKRALENLVRLHLSDYYGEPQAASEDEEAVQDMERSFTRRSKPAKPKTKPAKPKREVKAKIEKPEDNQDDEW